MGWRRRAVLVLAAMIAIVVVSAVLQRALAPDDAPAATTMPPPGRMPGVTAGDAALDVVFRDEAVRRCQIRWDLTKGRAMPPIADIMDLRSGDWHERVFHPGDEVWVHAEAARASFSCTLPGDLVPDQAALAALLGDEIPSDRRELLRRCSAALWHDLSSWTVIASAVLPRTIATLVAVSPSGKYAAQWELPVKALADSDNSRSSDGELRARIVSGQAAPQALREYDPPFNSSYFGHVYDTCSIRGLPCAGQAYATTRRLPRVVTKVRLESVRGGGPRPAPDGTVAGPVAGPSTIVEVKDGWLVVAWADGLKTTCRRARLTAYDASGRVVGVVSGDGSGKDCKPG